MSRKQKLNITTFYYKGKLEDEVEKAKVEVQKILDKLPIYEEIYLKAKKQYDRKVDRAKYLSEFVDLAETKLEEQDGTRF